MNAKKFLIPFFAVAILIAIAALAIFGRKSETAVVLAEKSPPPAPENFEPTPSAGISAPETQPPVQPLPKEIPPVARPEKIAAQAAPPPSANGQEPVQDPTARVALSLVGVDPEAEAYWVSSIFDTSLPDQEREDLMEDLNEDGLSDPEHPGPEDLPIILNRLAIIEEIAPNADPFMQEHLGEAYKDLNNLLDGLPVP